MIISLATNTDNIIATIGRNPTFTAVTKLSHIFVTVRFILNVLGSPIGGLLALVAVLSAVALVSAALLVSTATLVSVGAPVSSAPSIVKRCFAFAYSSASGSVTAL